MNSSGRCGWNQPRTWRSGTAKDARKRVWGTGPCSGGDYEGLRFINATIGYHFYLASSGLPLQHLLPAVHLSSKRLSRGDVGYDTPLGDEEAAVFLIDGEMIGREAVSREPLIYLGAVQYLVIQSVLLTRTK